MSKNKTKEKSSLESKLKFANTILEVVKILRTLIEFLVEIWNQ